MLKVRVQNFQSIIDETLVVDGLSAITGPNTTGKSAFLRAIKGLMQNARGNKFVRKGCKFCTVTVTFQNGDCVIWQKGKGVNRYKVNGEDWIEKPSGVPEDVLKVLGVSGVESGNKVLWPQIADQHEKIFLLNQSGSVMAETLADVERVGLLNDSLRASESDRRKINTRLSLRLEDLGAVDKSLKFYEGFGSVEKGLSELLDLSESYEKLNSKIDKLSRVSSEISKSENKVSKLSSIRGVELDFSALGSLEKIDKKIKNLEKVSRLYSEIQKNLSFLNKSSHILSGLKDLESQFSELETLDCQIRNMESLNSEVLVAVRKIGELKEKSDSVNRLIAEKEDLFKDQMHNLGVCPLCQGGVS